MSPRSLMSLSLLSLSCGRILVAGDGRYYNSEATQTICRVLAANGVRNIWVPQHMVMTTPAVSAAIRTRHVQEQDGTVRTAKGGVILTASHNPGGPGEDFGIKYNLELGQPAGEDFTDELYDRTLSITSYKTLENSVDMDWSAPVGTVYQLSATSRVTIIDPFEEYVAVLKSCFDFPALKSFAQKGQFSLLYDGMAGAGGPFARRVLRQELGLPEVRAKECVTMRRMLVGEANSCLRDVSASVDRRR
jgi:phosphoglucomutase